MEMQPQSETLTLVNEEIILLPSCKCFFFLRILALGSELTKEFFNSTVYSTNENIEKFCMN